MSGAIGYILLGLICSSVGYALGRLSCKQKKDEEDK